MEQGWRCVGFLFGLCPAHGASKLSSPELAGARSSLHFITCVKDGTQEMAWMRENWPMSETVAGLDDRIGTLLPHKWRCKDVKDVQEWTYLYSLQYICFIVVNIINIVIVIVRVFVPREIAGTGQPWFQS